MNFLLVEAPLIFLFWDFWKLCHYILKLTSIFSNITIERNFLIKKQEKVTQSCEYGGDTLSQFCVSLKIVIQKCWSWIFTRGILWKHTAISMIIIHLKIMEYNFISVGWVNTHTHTHTYIWESFKKFLVLPRKKTIRNLIILPPDMGK